MVMEFKSLPQEQDGPVPESPYGPGVLQRGNNLYRSVEIEAGDGTVRTQERQVARTLDQAKALRIDYYQPGRGWLRDGYKWENDQTPEEIMADGSSSRLVSVEEQERLREQAVQDSS